jgi:hypothetical protein
MERRAIISFGLLTISVSLLLVGPSKLLFPDEQTYLIFIGLGGVGVGMAGALSPTVPELVGAV